MNVIVLIHQKSACHGKKEIYDHLTVWFGKLRNYLSLEGLEVQ
jgi:hypothetical protein